MSLAIPMDCWIPLLKACLHHTKLCCWCKHGHLSQNLHEGEPSFQLILSIIFRSPFSWKKIGIWWFNLSLVMNENQGANKYMYSIWLTLLERRLSRFGKFDGNWQLKLLFSRCSWCLSTSKGLFQTLHRKAEQLLDIGAQDYLDEWSGF